MPIRLGKIDTDPQNESFGDNPFDIKIIAIILIILGLILSTLTSQCLGPLILFISIPLLLIGITLLVRGGLSPEELDEQLKHGLKYAVISVILVISISLLQYYPPWTLIFIIGLILTPIMVILFCIILMIDLKILNKE